MEFIILTSALVLVGIYVFDPVGAINLRTSFSDLEKSVRDELPIGSTIEDVEDFLIRKNIKDRSEIYALPDFRKSAMNLPDDSKIIHAIVRDVYNSVFIESSIEMEFYFSDRGELIKSDVKIISTSV